MIPKEAIRAWLGIYNLTESITEYRRKWMENVCRMQGVRVPFKVFRYTRCGR